ncbi:MAG: YIP1 family protein [archaeon]
MNLLGVFYSPKNTVKNAIEHPSIKLAVFLILLPLIIAAIGSYLFGFQVAIDSIIIKFIAEIILWLITALVLLIIIYLFGMKQIRTKFSGIITALSLVKLILSLFLLIAILMLPLSISSEIIHSFAEFEEGEIGTNELSAKISEELNNNPNAFNPVIFMLFALIGLILFLLTLYIYYCIISVSSGFSMGKSIIVWIAFIIILGAITPFFT